MKKFYSYFDILQYRAWQVQNNLFFGNFFVYDFFMGKGVVLTKN